MQNGTLCYIPDNEKVWIPVQVLNHDNTTGIVTVITQEDNEKKEINLNDPKIKELISNKGTTTSKDTNMISLPLQNDQLNEDGVEDMTTLNYLHEAAILYNIKVRFLKQLPYTYTGNICVAVNPYQWLPNLYTEDEHIKYLNIPKDKLPPHVYAISISSYNHMKINNKNQSILVSGESGAGKTETTKILMNHLATISGGLDDKIIKKIIQVNPLLESFGNAKTIRNDNSSRFGKFTQLQFDLKYNLVGAKCQTYLLEKTRVISHENKERNFHIFYQLLESNIKQLHLDLNKNYLYIGNNNNTIHIEGISDEQYFLRTKTALELIGLTEKDQMILFHTLAGILHLGQIEFEPKNNNDEESVIKKDKLEYNALDNVASSFALDILLIKKSLCNRTMIARDDIYSVPLKPKQAADCRDALAKSIYSNIFDWLVRTINHSLSAKEKDKKYNTIGVLDIFGFEHFEHNSFEQFCINYANEKLQQKFTQDVFKNVQIEYEQENIEWNHIEFTDNQNVLNLIESKMGIISLLNEEIMRPRGSDESFVNKIATLHKEDHSDIIEFPRTSRTKFIIKHYAAPVIYETIGFLEKHKDALLPDLSELMRSSTIPFIRSLFEEEKINNNHNDKNDIKKKGNHRNNSSHSLISKTVGTQFKINLSTLMGIIQSTEVHYVRCIKPNASKSPNEINNQMVVSQLRCSGVIEAIRISRSAYPNRMIYNEFLLKFYIFIRQNDKYIKSMKNDKEKCKYLCLNIFQLESPKEYQLGNTKIYLQMGIMEKLQDKMIQILNEKAIYVQKIIKGYYIKKLYHKKLNAIIKLQSVMRCVSCMNSYHHLLKVTTFIQAHFRGNFGRIKAREIKKNKMAIILTKYLIGYGKRRHFLKLRTESIKIQSVIRMKFQRNIYLKTLKEKKDQADMTSQLHKLQKRLEQEKKRNNILKKEVILDNNSQERNSSRDSGVIHDAGGMIEKLREENEKILKQNQELKIKSTNLYNELEKIKKDKDIIQAKNHVKIHQLEAQIKLKDRKIMIVQNEYEELRDYITKNKDTFDHTNNKIKNNKLNKKFRRIGSGKNLDPLPDDARLSLLNNDLDNDTNDLNKIDVNRFLKSSAKRMSKAKFWPTTNGIHTNVKSPFNIKKIEENISNISDQRNSNKSIPNNNTSIYTNIKGKMAAAVKGKFNPENDPSTKSVIKETLNLDSIVDSPLPSGWVKKVSRSKGKVYYYNQKLNINQWTKPTN